MSQPRAILILAGGAGTRLWPLSTDDNPKQFLQIFGGRSLLQNTFARLASFVRPEAIYVSTNERYRSKVAEQLPDVPVGNVLVEPARRNTAPAIAVCCEIIAARLGDPAIGIFPSDHAIGDEPAFREVIDRAFLRAEQSDDLLTIGITPTEPSTGYGYLELGDSIFEGLRSVRRFVEKPDRERAEQFVDSGNFAWNGGMFVWRARAFRDAMRSASPEIAQLAARYATNPSPETYEQMPSISIDYALMERAPNVAASTGEFGWSDVGSWQAVARIAGDNLPPHVLAEESRQIFVATGGEKRVAIVGLENIAVIDSPDGLLVVNLDRAELLSSVVRKLTP